MKLARTALISASAFFLIPWATAQQTSPTADQILDNYIKAVGGMDKFSAVQTWTEKAEVTGDLSTYNPVISSVSTREHGTVETYYKAPNLWITFVRTDKNIGLATFGCDGTSSWDFFPRMGFDEHRAQPGDEGNCRTLAPLPIRLRERKAKLKLKGQKEIDGL